MKYTWLYLSREDILTERRQCEEEGRDLSLLENQFENVLSLDLDDLSNQAFAERLLDQTIELPIRAGYTYHEPSDLDSIRQARPAHRPTLPRLTQNEAERYDRIYGAWLGRVCGCLLGKPVEGWRRNRMWGYLMDTHRFPLNDYFYYQVPADIQKKYDLQPQNAFADLIQEMPADDDLNYTTAGMTVLQRYGSNFTPAQVAEFWLSDIPILRTCTAERVAYRNLVELKAPPLAASFRNPYREWIGAQIRADFYGYAAAGNPELAAEFAWRDASISHVKNGIYGAMWVAAMTAAAFVMNDVRSIIEVGLSQIPERSRLAAAIQAVLQWHRADLTYDEAVERIHQQWDETRAHDWCHTISNAIIVATALMWGEGDWVSTITKAVQACFDTDCNGATAGSIVGIMTGAGKLPSKWTEVVHDTLNTDVAGYNKVKISEMAKATLPLVYRTASDISEETGG